MSKIDYAGSPTIRRKEKKAASKACQRRIVEMCPDCVHAKTVDLMTDGRERTAYDVAVGLGISETVADEIMVRLTKQRRFKMATIGGTHLFKAA